MTVAAWISERASGAFPWGTLVVNVSGSLTIAVDGSQVQVDPDTDLNLR